MMHLSGLQEKFLNQLVSTSASKLASADRISIYRRNYEGALKKALANRYPVTVRLLGSEYFDYIASLYVTTHPSQSYNLNEYGLEFPNFIVNLQQDQNSSLSRIAYMADIADFESAVYQVLFGPENSVFDFQSLATLSEEQQGGLIFTLAENSQMLSSIFPIDTIWEMNQPEVLMEEIEEMEAIDLQGKVRAPQDPYLFLLWRKDLDLCMMRLDASQKTLVLGLQQRMPLANLAKAYELEYTVLGSDSKLASGSDPNSDPLSTLIMLIKQGCITGYELA